MAYILQNIFDALLKNWRYTMIYRFVNFEAIDQVFTTEKRSKQNFKST